MNNQPGTVSKIHWHFTGGPVWDENNNKQSSTIKTNKEAYNILKQILESKKIKKSKFNEIFNTIVPIDITIDKVAKLDEIRQSGIKIKENVHKSITTEQVCCVADIPIQHLHYHANRYGKCAIGFYREKTIEQGFQPVIYSLIGNKLNTTLYSIYDQINYLNQYFEIITELSSYLQELENKASDNRSKRNKEIASSIKYYNDLLIRNQQDILAQQVKVLSSVKTFTSSEFDSIYTEREWRLMSDYNFSFEDVSMIILPKEDGIYTKGIEELKLPRTIPIIPWEEVIEN